jgi:uncharacterized protein with FMN-binding domain
MRRAVLALLSTVTALVLLLSFKTHGTTSTVGPTAGVGSSGIAGSTSGSTGSSGSGSGSGSGSSGSTASGSSGTETVTGDSVNTRWGPVQVRITRTNGKITAVQAVDYPQGNSRDQEINSYAIPVLSEEAVAANSASIDMVSGATYTSEGYISSLQSALDKAA